MGLAGVPETVEVVGTRRRRADPDRAGGHQLPAGSDRRRCRPTRDINATLLLAPAVHPTGPSGAYSIAGSMSFENLFMVNGVTVNENLRGPAERPVHRGRDSGNDRRDRRHLGRVRPLQRRRRQRDHQVGRQPVLRVVPRHAEQRQLANADAVRRRAIATTSLHKDTQLDKIVPTYEYTFGGPISKDRLWFFTAGRISDPGGTPERWRSPTFPTPSADKTQRYEGKGTYSLNSNHRFQGNYIKIADDQVNNTFNPSPRWTCAAWTTRERRRTSRSLNYSGVLTPTLFVEARCLAGISASSARARRSTDLDRRHAADRQARSNRRYWSPTFCGVCTPEERDNENIYVKASYFLSTQRHRLAQHGRSATTTSTTSASPTTTSRAATTASSATASIVARAAPDDLSAVSRRRHDRSSSGIRSRSAARARISEPTRCSSTTAGA